eukprot:scaffold17236_cov51-Phaeocystis_antarctica.AAC.2
MRVAGKLRVKSWRLLTWLRGMPWRAVGCLGDGLVNEPEKLPIHGLLRLPDGPMVNFRAPQRSESARTVSHA